MSGSEGEWTEVVATTAAAVELKGGGVSERKRDRERDNWGERESNRDRKVENSGNKCSVIA